MYVNKIHVTEMNTFMVAIQLHSYVIDFMVHTLIMTECIKLKQQLRKTLTKTN